MTTPETEKLKKKVSRMLDTDGEGAELDEYKGYAGRGMYGKASPLAFVTGTSPGSTMGKKFVKMGFTVDNMGLDYIYYLKA